MKLSWIVAAEQFLPAAKRRRAARLLGHLDGSRDWHPITTAPFNRDMEARIREAHSLRALPFPCRRTAAGWVNSDLGVRVEIDPVAWRPWSERA